MLTMCSSTRVPGRDVDPAILYTSGRRRIQAWCLSHATPRGAEAAFSTRAYRRNDSVLRAPAVPFAAPMASCAPLGRRARGVLETVKLRPHASLKTRHHAVRLVPSSLPRHRASRTGERLPPGAGARYGCSLAEPACGTGLPHRPRRVREDSQLRRAEASRADYRRSAFDPARTWASTRSSHDQQSTADETSSAALSPGG